MPRDDDEELETEISARLMAAQVYEALAGRVHTGLLDEACLLMQARNQGAARRSGNVVELHAISGSKGQTGDQQGSG